MNCSIEFFLTRVKLSLIVYVQDSSYLKALWHFISRYACHNAAIGKSSTILYLYVYVAIFLPTFWKLKNQSYGNK